MARKKKVLSAGKFGARYGMRLRKKWLDVDVRQRRPHECPVCSKKAVRRLASGIWQCRKCGVKFAGGAYLPAVGVAKPIEKIEAEEGEGGRTSKSSESSREESEPEA